MSCLCKLMDENGLQSGYVEQEIANGAEAIDAEVVFAGNLPFVLRRAPGPPGDTGPQK